MLLTLKQFTMEKSSVPFLERFRPKDVKMRSQRLNRFLRKRWSYFLLGLFASCGVQNSINTDDFKRISPDFKARFYDQLDTIRYQNDSKVYTRSLIKDLVQLETIDYSQPIGIEIKKDKLFIQFQDQAKKRYVIQYFGKLSTNKFVFYTNYETINFPIVYISKSVSKYTIYLSDLNEMIVKDFTENDGMVLFFGAGGSSSTTYKFKLIKNE